jgi:Flp pilus assembly protein TadD
MNGAPTPAQAGGRSGILDEVAAAIRTNDMATAMRLAREGLARGAEHPLLLNLRALDHEDHGRYPEALADLQRAHLLSPSDFTILNACGLALARLNRFEDALLAHQGAVGLEPRFAPGWFNMGWTFEQLGDLPAAAEAYEKSVELAPQNAQAWANLAWLGARRGDPEAVKRFAAKALEVQPGHPTARLAEAAAGLSDPSETEAQLRGLLAQQLSTYDRGLALSLLGDALDAQDRCAEAFAAYEAGNGIFSAEAGPQYDQPGQPTVADALNWLVRWAKTSQPGERSGASAAEGDDNGREHVFLMGFARSGTTLIESVLTAHPDIVSLEERDALKLGVQTFMGDANALTRLGRLGERELQPYRDDYWRNVRSHGVEPSGKVFIDKNPFHTLKLPLIVRLFPRAKIVFAVRDPRDVVLSCFRRRFNLNPSTYELLDLRRAAVFYVGAMQLAEILRGKLGFGEHRLVFERLVADFEGEGRALCGFLGVDWRPELIDFAGRARRGAVASASSAQISRGLNADGAGQWRRYRAQLSPVLGMLQPWAERFGYPAE